MKLNKIKINLIPVTILLILLSVISTAQSQKKNIQIQIGGQIMQNYNLGGFESFIGSYTSTIVKKDIWESSFNKDISLSYLLNSHGIVIGIGNNTMNNLLDFEYYDDIGRYIKYQIKSTYKNYNLYILYQLTQKILQRLDGHLSLGPMWAKNHNQADWFFVPVKFNYFSCIGKLGFQYLINDHFTFDLNGMAVRSFTNIVDQNQASEGSIIPFLLGLDFRIGYQF